MKTVKLILIFLSVGLLSLNTFANDSERVALFKKNFVEFLSKEGYVPKIDLDGDIVFKSSGETFYVNIDGASREELLFVAMYRISNSGELDDLTYAKLVSAINEANRKYRVIKGVYDRDRVYFSTELWVPNSRQFELHFKYYMLVYQVVSDFLSDKIK